MLATPLVGPEPPPTPRTAFTSTLLVRREAFRDCGGFDEELGCFEDWDLCLRAAREWTFD